MNWYLMAWKRFAEFEGRSRRKEYWMFCLFNILVVLALFLAGVMLSAMLHSVAILTMAAVLYILYCVAVILPSLACAVRRLHDTGKSGAFLLLCLIPLVGGIIVLVFLLLDSQPGANMYGANPKYSNENPGHYANPGTV